MTTQLILIFCLLMITQAITSGAYAARLAGVRTKHPALAGSLYNVLNLVARATNGVAAPLIASMTDGAVQDQNIKTLLLTYRVVLLASTGGTIVAGLLIPTLSRVLARGVESYGMRQSLPRVVVNAASVQGLWNIRHEVAAPRLSVLRESRKSPFPKRFLIASILVTAISTVTIPATMYASALVPEGPRTATSLSALLAGVPLFLTTFLITPIAAVIIDEALRGKRPLKDVTYITVWQIGAGLIGTLVAQILLTPTGWLIANIARWLVRY